MVNTTQSPFFGLAKGGTPKIVAALKTPESSWRRHLLTSFQIPYSPKKSIMMHSMGNRAISNGACGKGMADVQFKNIFMHEEKIDQAHNLNQFFCFIATIHDVPFDIFHNYPGNGLKNKETKAEHFIKNMLKKNPDGLYVGKIYILHRGEMTVGRVDSVKIEDDWHSHVVFITCGSDFLRCNLMRK
eukprot:jgi/Psemu1/33755/gm1.33755_g